MDGSEEREFEGRKDEDGEEEMVRQVHSKWRDDNVLYVCMTSGYLIWRARVRIRVVVAR